MVSVAVSRRRGLLFVVLLFIGIVATHLDVVPFWDAKNYFQCVANAVSQPFDPLNFRCAGHPSIIYELMWGSTQYVKPFSPALLYVVNAMVGAASIAAFDQLTRRLFPKRQDTEYTLVTALYAFAPLFVSHAIFLNLDYGATAFFVLFLFAMLSQRLWLAGAFGVALAFTKETGAAAMAVATGAYVTAFVLRPGISWTKRLATLRLLGPLLAVPIAVAAYVLYARVSRQQPGGLVALYAPVQAVPDSVEAILNTNLADPSMQSFLADLFLLNFQWLYTGTIAVALCAALIRVESPAAEPGEGPRRGLFLGLMVVGLAYVVTRYRFSNGARYVLLATPVLILSFYQALLVLAARYRLRLLWLSLCALLVFLSNFRTLDVVSRSFFGTFPFGSHRLLDMTSRSGGLRLDSVVYNLEFVQLQYLFGDAIRDLRPAYGSVLLMGNAIYNFPPAVDGRDYTLTVDASHAVPFFVALGDTNRDVFASHIRRDGELFFYISFPNAEDVGIEQLRTHYPLVGIKKYVRSGYALEVYTFRFLLS